MSAHGPGRRMRQRLKTLIAAVVLTGAVFLTTLPVQLAEAHVPTINRGHRATVEIVEIGYQQAQDDPTPAPGSHNGDGNEVAWLTITVIALPVLAVAIAIAISINRRRINGRPTRRQGQTY